MNESHSSLGLQLTRFRSGGAVFPPIQGAIADAANTRISYVVPTIGFVVVLAYVAVHWARHGFHILRVKGENVVAASLEGGAVGGVVQTVHYDERKLSTVDAEAIRRSSLGGARVNSITGGFHMDAEKTGHAVETVEHSHHAKW